MACVPIGFFPEGCTKAALIKLIIYPVNACPAFRRGVRFLLWVKNVASTCFYPLLYTADKENFFIEVDAVSMLIGLEVCKDSGLNPLHLVSIPFSNILKD